jgi:hypothetical protein
MLTLTKNQDWETWQLRLSRTIDGLGCRIDPGIMNTVIALNANDIHTIASCEGHLAWGAPYPWVDIRSGSPRVAEMEQSIAELLADGKRGSEEMRQLDTELRCIHYQEEQRLIEALESFYRVFPLDYDRHLTLYRIARGGCRMKPHGADIQEIRTSSERTEKLAEYQREMQSFAEFLKGRFFESEGRH